MGEWPSVLWTKIIRSNDATKIDQSCYIADIMIRFGISERNPNSTQMDYDQKLSVSMCPKGEEINLLSRYGNNSGKQRETRNGYLKGTIDKGIVHRKQKEDDIKGYSHPDWAGYVRSTLPGIGHNPKVVCYNREVKLGQLKDQFIMP
uniref:Reverse transcriptase Ty1/copia-type domain-containing protein n=1 Tax=Glossina palpalis gambiensis TaxID=67801 RepID=A0A1B0BC46_9MUSC